VSNAKKPGTGTTNKRRRSLAGAKYERQMARRADRAARQRRRRQITFAIVAMTGILALAGVLIVPRFLADDSSEAQPAPSASPASIGCDAAPTPSEKPATFKKAPANKLAAGTKYTLTLNTNCGKVAIETDTDAPKTVNAMLWLAEQEYFNSSPCHRLTTKGIFVLQCGDPTGTGTGGPGFKIPDENLPKAGDANYPKGTVAMANAGPGTSGSQFFLVYKDTTLPANYTIWGRITKGLDVITKVADAGVIGESNDGQPQTSIGILSTKVHPALG
jgi:peptidyl-prolyl cis-trans isomerase B (cyclophilin B)